MDWKKEAIKTLMEYEARQQSLENIPMEIECLKQMQEELARRLDTTKVWCSIIDSTLAILDDQDRLVLEKFFIHRQKGACEELCEELNREKAQIYRYRDSALNHFTTALYGGLGKSK